LTGAIEPPSPWIAVDGDDFLGEPYYRREAARPQAFAVAVGSEWAGSIPTVDRMNREYLLGVRQQLPPGLAQLFPYPWATISPDLYEVAILHELFHAYQATRTPGRMDRATGIYAVEKLYPYGDPDFSAAWDREGALLAGALKAPDDGSVRELVRQFLQVRKERRVEAGLGEELLAYERELEWLEGLGKYAEIRFYELAEAQPQDSGLATYRPGLPHWQMEFGRLENQLGRQGGDFRFYLAGMAMARVMDRLSPGWKEQALQGDLEELLRAAAGQG
jgi:hypothetical protein